MPAILDLLLIEDSEAHAELVRRALRPVSDVYALRNADCLAAARKALAEKKPDIVISDLRLPDGTALDLLPSSPEDLEWPMIVLTGEGDENQAVASIKAGALDYLVKSGEAIQGLPGSLGRALREWGHIVGKRSMEAQLHDSEERFRRLFDLSPVGAALLDSSRHIIRSNRALEDLLGRKESDLAGQDICVFSHPEDADIGRTELNDIVEGRYESARYEKRYLREDGIIVWGLVTSRLMSERQGAQLFFIHVIQDITETRRFEDALQESNRRLNALFEDANDAIFLADPDTGLITELNRAAEQLLGVSRNTLIGLPHTALLPSEEAPRASHYFKEVVATSCKRIVEMEVATRHRGNVHVEISASLVPLPREKRVFMGIFRDLTERRTLEAQLWQAQKMEAVGQLAGGVAHDFNNVLAAIMLQLGMLQNDNRIPPELKSSLALLDGSTKRAADLTRQLLLFGRRQPVRLQPIDLDVLLANLLKMLRRLIGETVRLDFDPQPGRHWMQGDIGMIEQVIMNLVVNARDAMPSGGSITIEIKRTEAKAPAEWSGGGNGNLVTYLCLSVRDTGVGMDETTLKRIFEPFFTTKEQGKGTGLGLATAYGIVKQHHGWIKVESHPGEGSLFSVYLPSRTAPTSHSPNLDHQPTPSQGSETVLLVEDDAIVRTFTGLSLRAIGYSVIEATHAHEALELWARDHRKVQVLLSDMVMPEGMNGWELAKKLRADRPELPVVLMSGYSTDLPRVAMEPDGGVIFLQKPFDGVRLSQAMRSALRK